MTIAVVTTHTMISFTQVCSIIPNEFISSAPAGIKKNARWSNKKSEIFSIWLTLITLVHRRTSKMIIPKMLPGIGKLAALEIKSPSK